jgi:hypothetical protein
MKAQSLQFSFLDTSYAQLKNLSVESKTGAVALGFRWFVATLSSYRLSPTYHNSVSHPRSSNRTCGTTASGFPTDFTLQYTKKTHFICDKRAHLCFLLHSKV